jgi:hypothetical protein
MIIEGVRPSADEFVNGPAPLNAPWEAATAAYNTLFGPAAIAAMFPKKSEVPE